MNNPSASSGVSTPKIKYRVVRSKGREILPLEIYHNVSLYAPLKRPQGVSDGKPVKQATNHPKTRQKRAGSVFTACMSMHASA